MKNSTITYDKFVSSQRKVEESILSIANGYLGMRASFEEGMDPSIDSVEGTYINGFYDFYDINYAAKYTGYPDLYQRMVPLINMQNIEIFLNNKRYLFEELFCRDYHLKLDMATGEVSRCYTYVINAQETIEFNFKKILSQTKYELFSQQITISFNLVKPKQVKFVFPTIFKEQIVDKGIPNDPRAGKEGNQAFLELERKFTDNYAAIVYQTLRSNKTYAYGTMITGLESFASICNDEGIAFTKEITSETIAIEKTSVMYENQFDETSIENVKNKLEAYHQQGYQANLKQTKDYFKTFWAKAESYFGDSNKSLEAPNNFNMFQLYTNVGRLAWTNIAAKGLTGEGYAGHYFWDSEIYIITALTLFDANLAKQMLMFRYNTLPQARQRAITLAHTQGALYPWRTINGEETSTYFPAGTAQYHINGDIAYTIVNYYKATKDTEFLFNYGIDILTETARLWVDKIVVSDNIAHINSITGPDEYQIIVNDDYWTNCVAQNNLVWAEKTFMLLQASDPKLYTKKVTELNISQTEIEKWKLLSNQFKFEIDGKLKIIAQHDNFLKRKPVDKTYIEKYKPFLRTLHPLSINTLRVTKQADVVLADLFFYQKNSLSVMKNNWFFYDATDTADSSLSKCIYAIMAARLKIGDYGFEYFKQAINLDLYDTHKNTDRGLHMANMGGARMFAIYGLLGINIELNYLEIDPRYNQAINEYSVKLEYQKALLEFEVTNEKLIIKNTNKQAVTIKFKNDLYTLENEMELTI